MAEHGRHYCGGIIVDAELSCAIGERDGHAIAVILPGYTCSSCGEPQLHSDQLDVLADVLDGGPYEHLKYVRLGADVFGELAAIAV
jgi:hypothetical protein